MSKEILVISGSIKSIIIWLSSSLFIFEFSPVKFLLFSFSSVSNFVDWPFNLIKFGSDVKTSDDCSSVFISIYNSIKFGNNFNVFTTCSNYKK